MTDVEALLRITPVFRNLGLADRQKVATVTTIRRYEKGATIFEQGVAADQFYTISEGRVKIARMMPTGKELILEVFGAGDPLGAVAAYDGRAFPASAVALEDTTCLAIPRERFFELLEQHPSLVRGLMLGLTHRLVELTNSLAELSGGKIESRFARLFLKLGAEMGRQERGGTFVPMALSRQDLAGMTGTTIETCIRIMSRWGKQNVVLTEKDGFVIVDRGALESAAGGE